MATALSKYALNQFEVTTRERHTLMSDILLDAFDRVTVAAAGDAAFQPALAEVTAARDAWNAGETQLANAEAAQLSATLALEEKLATLTRKPNADTNSLLETWDLTLRAVTPRGSVLYTRLLPRGRRTLTAGSIDERIDAIRDFGARLSEQSDPAMLLLGAAHVAPFATAARALRDAQGRAVATVEARRQAQETLRVSAAQTLYAMVATAMSVYRDTPARVDELFHPNLLRRPSRKTPKPPGATVCDPPTCTLSAAAQPKYATRLEAWRQTPGGAPERLAVGERDALSVAIPPEIVFRPGEPCRLWLAARNSKGTSAPGPLVVWTAP